MPEIALRTNTAHTESQISWPNPLPPEKAAPSPLSAVLLLQYAYKKTSPRLSQVRETTYKYKRKPEIYCNPLSSLKYVFLSGSLLKGFSFLLASDMKESEKKS